MKKMIVRRCPHDNDRMNAFRLVKDGKGGYTKAPGGIIDNDYIGYCCPTCGFQKIV
jgi:hypothetical protein